MRALAVVTLITAGALVTAPLIVVALVKDQEAIIKQSIEEGNIVLKKMSESLGRTRTTLNKLRGPQKEEIASWYGEPHRGKPTSNGEKFDPRGYTCASWDYMIGEILEIQLGTRRVFVRVNDRGPARWTGRTLDLSEKAAEVLGFKDAGEARVMVRVVE